MRLLSLSTYIIDELLISGHDDTDLSILFKTVPKSNTHGALYTALIRSRFSRGHTRAVYSCSAAISDSRYVKV